MKRPILALLLIVAVLFSIAPGAASNAAPLAQDTPKIWSVDWNISAYGDLTERDGAFTTYSERSIRISGSTILRETEDGTVAQPFSLAIYDERTEITTSPDSKTIDTVTIVDPLRYNGGNDIYLSSLSGLFLEPFRGSNGQWMFRPEIFGNFFWASTFPRFYTYRFDSWDDVEGRAEPWYGEVANYWPALLNQPTSEQQYEGLPGNEDGTVFTLDTTFTAGEEAVTGLQMEVNFYAQIRAGLDCAARGGVIDASDPSLSGRQLDLLLETDTPEILPNGEAEITAELSCEGVPVKGAKLDLGGFVIPRSGGHAHTAGRPDGYINGIKITPANRLKTTTLTTDENGMVAFRFAPGKDTRNEQIGIAGRYYVSVRGATLNASDSLAITARVPGLLPLPPGTNYKAALDLGALSHPANDYATPGTIERIKIIANQFELYQQSLNAARIARGEAALPIVPLYVNDISLPWGGLFDVIGWDNNTNRLRGTAWQPPHYSHTDGTTVDFAMSDWRSDLTPEQFNEAANYLRAGLRLIGRQQGTWAGGPTLTLQLPKDSTAELAQADGPNPGVVAMISDPDRASNPVVAPTALISLTFAVENVLGSAAAEAGTLLLTFPAGLTPQQNPQKGLPSLNSAQQVVLEVASLAAGATPELYHVTAAVDPNLAAGTVLTVTAQLVSNGDVSADNNTDTVSVVVRPAAADLLVSSTIADVAHTPDASVTFAAQVLNHGTTTAQIGELTVTLPLSATLAGATAGFTQEGNVLRWPISFLHPNIMQSVTATVTIDPLLLPSVDPDAPIPMLNYTVAATIANDADESDNQQTLTVPVERAGTDLAAGLDMSGTPAVGQELTYRINYGNYGNQIAASSVITLSLGSGLEVLSAVPAADTTTPDGNWSGGLLSWNLGNIVPGEEGVITLRVRVVSATPDGASAMVVATSDTPDMKPTNNGEVLVMGLREVSPTQFQVFLPMLMR